jgi:RND family efflux transporter MFP subunit
MVVVTAPVTMATINDKLTAIGEGAAAQSVTVVSPASGTLRELAVKPGDEVAANAVIGRLDAEAEEIAAERARLAFADAETALERTNELARANSATTVQATAAKLAHDNARLELQNADLALARRTITTPIAGTVGLFQVSPGNTVTGQSVVTTIEDISSIRVGFWVPERYAPSVAVGMSVTANAVALPGVSIPGVVSAVDNRIDTTSRTLKVEAEIPNEDGRLRPGMSFSVSLSFPGEQFPTVDPLAIQWSSEGSYLWRYVDGKVERTPVEIIQRNSDGVLVKADLAAGDQVVTQGVQQLTPGATVRLLDEPAGAAADAQRPGQGGASNPS